MGLYFSDRKLAVDPPVRCFNAQKRKSPAEISVHCQPIEKLTTAVHSKSSLCDGNRLFWFLPPACNDIANMPFHGGKGYDQLLGDFLIGITGFN
jgi:hypothetical protein